MNARSALLVAVVACLGGGALWLARTLDTPSARVSRSSGGDASRGPATAPTAGEAGLSAAAVEARAARASVGGDSAAVAANDPVALSTRSRVRVIRERTSPEEVVVPNARVEIVDTGHGDGPPRWDVEAKGETDASGLFAFDASRSFHATVRAEATIDGRKFFGVSWARVPGAVPGPIVVQVSETPRAEIRFSVIDRDTLLPIVGADVRTQDGAEPTTTNALGEFSVWVTSDPVATHVMAWIGASGYFPVDWDSWMSGVQQRSVPGRKRPPLPFEANPPARTEKPVVYLRRSARLAGSVQKAAGARVEGAELRTRIHFSEDAAYKWRDVLAVTDDRGRFVFEALPAGLALGFEVRVRGETVQCDTSDFELEPGESREVTLRVRGHVELTGRVLDVDDKPVKGGKIKVSIDGQSDEGSIRSDGTYYLPFAVAGSGWITVVRADQNELRTEHERVPILIPLSVAEWTFDVRLIPASSVAGVILDAEGGAVQRAALHLNGEGTPTLETHVVNARGEFRFDAVPAGEYTLVGRELDGAQRSVRLTVRAGDQNVILRLPPQGSLSGRVAPANDGGDLRATVNVEGDTGTFFTIQCERDGTFHAAASVGSLWIWAELGDARSRFEHVSVTAGADTVVPNLELVPSAPVRFVTGRSAGRVLVEVHGDAGLCFHGYLDVLSDRTIRVPLGTAQVVVTCAGKPPELRTIQVRAGETAFVPIVGP